MHQLRMNQFPLPKNLHFDGLFHNIREFEYAVTNDCLHNNIVVSKWNQSIDLTQKSKGPLVEFTKQKSQKSKLFEYWNVFLDSIVPVLRDVEASLEKKIGQFICQSFEYYLHHDFSDAVTAQDIKFFENIINFGGDYMISVRQDEILSRFAGIPAVL